LVSNSKKPLILLLSVFIISFCALIYQLLIGSVSSYFLGDSVKQFSLTIGFFMAGMGLGSYLSRLIKNKLLINFIHIEILLGLLGGISIPLLYASFSYTYSFQGLMITLTLLIGTLIGFEIPLLTRILSSTYKLQFNLSNVLTLDYLGALIATILFPFIILPAFGTFRTSLIFGFFNLATGFFTFYVFRKDIEGKKHHIIWFYSIIFSTILVLGIFFSSFLLQYWNDTVFRHKVVLAKQSKYQQIVLTAKNSLINLYLNGHLQFSSYDEYRYHEALATLPGTLAPIRNKILILGGGDGLAVKQLLKFKDIQSITLVDIDPEITKTAQDHLILTKLNDNSLNDPKVNIVNDDAFSFLLNSKDKYDLIIGDLPDPSTVSLAKLYSVQFYRMILNRLNSKGIFVTQATNTFSGKEAFWCIEKSIKAAGFNYTYPYHLHIPSFGEWGFVLATAHHPIDLNISLNVPTKFLTPDIVNSLFYFPKDLIANEQTIKVSSLDSPRVLQYYLKGWKHWN